MKKNPWWKVLGFGALAGVVVMLFFFNLSMLHSGRTMGGTFNNTVFTGLAALITVALFVWSVVSARKESQEPEDLSDPSAQEQWEKAHPGLTDGSYRVEKPKEKHSAGYWVKEFFRLGGLPAVLVVGIWLGSYCFILKPLEPPPETSAAYNEEQNKYEIKFLHKNLVKLPDSVVEEKPVSLLGYQIPELPAGFSWMDEDLEEYRKVIYNSPTYQDQNGCRLHFEVWRSNNGYSVSLDNAAHTEELTVNGYPGVLVEYEDGSMELAWGDLEHTAVLSIRAGGVDRETIFRLAEGFTYREE